jgi:dolichol-phosphate mannosyltransferase
LEKNRILLVQSLVIIPTYNEAANIEALVTTILNSDSKPKILIVDDNSPDGTGRIADKIAHDHEEISVIHRPKKLGLGSAYTEGFRFALKTNAEVVFEIDADSSHDPGDIPEFLKAIQSYDLVIGSRYLRGVSVVNWPIRRLMLSKFATSYVRAITGLPLTDATSGFKCIRRSVLEALDLDRIRSNGYAFQIEVNYKAYSKGFRIGEVPIIFVERNEGVSKMSKEIVLEAILIAWKLRLGL